MWVDTHCHLQLDARPADELIDRAADVEWLVVPGVDARTSQAAAELADRYPGRLEWTAGLHPHDAERWPGEEAEITRLAARAAAVGECGLDYYRNLSDPEAQRAAFIAQIELADALGKPVVVHCRDAFADVHDILERTGYGPRTVLHCWTGGRRWTRRFLDLGVVFSFAGPLTYPTGETIRLAAELVPPDRAMVETDTPYLSPEPHRGEPNEPAWIAHTGEVLASVWGIGVEEAARLTTATAERVFRT
ncbi:MAG: TatD family hydrolase [Actinomycetes bacterium]|nr:TatD family deoxyribonuclease [Acidimicrobiia bacterium]